MLMADTMSIFFVILGMMLALPGLWLLCRGLWPEAVAAAADRCQKGLWSSFIAGLPITIIMVVIAMVLFKVLGPVGKVAGIGVICLYMLQAHTGVSGLVTSIGRRLVAPPLDEQRPWRTTLRGGVALELAYLLPFLGWFVILPVSIVIGSGAANLALLSKLRQAMFATNSALADGGRTASGQADRSVGAI